MRGHQTGIRTLQFNETKLVSASLDGEIKIWNWQTGECVQTLRCHTEGVISVHFDGEYLVSGSVDRTVKVINYDTRETCTFRATATGSTTCASTLPRARCSRLRTTAPSSCGDLDTKECIKTFDGHVGQVQQVLPLARRFRARRGRGPRGGCRGPTTPTRRRWASGASGSAASSNAQVPVWRPQPRLPRPSRSRRRPTRNARLTGRVSSTTRRGRCRRATCSRARSTRRVRLYSTASGKCLKTFFGHVEGIWGLVGDTLRIVTGANDAMVKVWSRSGKCERTFTGHAGPRHLCGAQRLAACERERGWRGAAL